MSDVFVDSSAVLALRHPGDVSHADAKRGFARLRAREAVLVTTSYVICEVYARLGRRFGLSEVQAFRAEFFPLLRVVWVDAMLHEQGLDLLVERGQESLSLVDAVSFVAMREGGLDEAFAFDRHVAREGYQRP